jgi:hypothetical protein
MLGQILVLCTFLLISSFLLLTTRALLDVYLCEELLLNARSRVKQRKRARALKTEAHTAATHQEIIS